MSNNTQTVHIGYVGGNATVNQNIVNKGNEDLTTIKQDLSKLCEYLENNAITLEQKNDANLVEQALQAANTGEKQKMLTHLRQVSKWAIETANQIGSSLIVEVIKRATGL